MDDQTLQRIFDLFFTIKNVGQDTELGLFVVHGIVEMHDGFITVRSRPEAGTTFEVYFPVTTQSTASPNTRASVSPARAAVNRFCWWTRL